MSKLSLGAKVSCKNSNSFTDFVEFHVKTLMLGATILCKIYDSWILVSLECLFLLQNDDLRCNFWVQIFGVAVHFFLYKLLTLRTLSVLLLHKYWS